MARKIELEYARKVVNQITVAYDTIRYNTDNSGTSDEQRAHNHGLLKGILVGVHLTLSNQINDREPTK